MVEALDLKTVMLAFGDYEEYTVQRTRGSHVFYETDNIYLRVDKLDVKISEKINIDAPSDDECRYLQLYQVRSVNIYLICDSVGINQNELFNINPQESFYSDSYLDASKRFKSALKENRDRQ
jgi:hypothetical protein